MIHLQQTREEVYQNTFKLQERIKKIYYRKAKVDKFQLEEVVLKWDARNEEKVSMVSSKISGKDPSKLLHIGVKMLFF